MLYFLLYKLLNMFRAAMCPSSGADDWSHGENTNQSSAPDDGHIVAWNMLSNL